MISPTETSTALDPELSAENIHLLLITNSIAMGNKFLISRWKKKQIKTKRRCGIHACANLWANNSKYDSKFENFKKSFRLSPTIPFSLLAFWSSDHIA
jgi:hypothetical protein